MAMVLGTPLAAVTIAGEFASRAGNSSGALGVADWQSSAEQALCERVIDSGEKLVLGGTRLDLRMSGTCLAGAVGVIAWAGFPAHGPNGCVVGAFCVADYLPRHWSDRDVEVLETLAQVARGEVALQAALRRDHFSRELGTSGFGPRAVRANRTHMQRFPSGNCSGKSQRSPVASTSAVCSVSTTAEIVSRLGTAPVTTLRMAAVSQMATSPATRPVSWSSSQAASYVGRYGQPHGLAQIPARGE
jgi:hypothetical protein